MKKTLTFLSLAFLSLNNIWAQAPSLQWRQNYGGSGADNAKSVCKTFDGGFVTVGFTESSDNDAVGQHGSRDILAIKTNSVGTIVWKRIIGGTSNDEAMAVAEKSADSSIVIAGFSESNNGDFASITHRGAKDLLVMNLKPNGTTNWIKKFGGTSNEQANAVTVDNFGNFIVAGYTASNDFDVTGNHLNGSSPTNDYWVLRINGTGSLIWAYCFGGNHDSFGSDGDDFAYAVSSNASGSEYFISGYSTSVDGNITSPKGGRDLWIVKLSTGGLLTWQKSLGGTNWEEPRSSVISAAGNLVVTGYSQSTDGDVTGLHGSFAKDIWVANINTSTGALISQKCLGGTNGEESYCIKSTSDNGFVISGYSASSDGDAPSALNSQNTNMGGWDWWITKLDASLNLTWQKKLGGPLTELGGYGIVETAPNEYVVTGIASNFFEAPANQFYGLEDYFLAKLGAVTTDIKNNEMLSFNAYPNPTSGKFIINLSENSVLESTVEITNMIGQIIYKEKTNSSVIEINLENNPNGIYFIQITSNNHLFTQKIIKQ